jgi:hypothetical protein
MHASRLKAAGRMLWVAAVKETVVPNHEHWPTIQSCEYVLSYDSLYDDPDHFKIVAEACAEFATAYF